ncbi:MAG: hypothetical protein PVF20_06535 [Desulfobacterales bacterium]|jgi:hypothetical protein
MTDPYDPKKSALSLKSTEGMIAFTGFKTRVGPEEVEREGVLKISAAQKPYRGDCLILTFILDAHEAHAVETELEERFQNLAEPAVIRCFGAQLESVVVKCLDDYLSAPGWYIQDVSYCFKVQIEQKKTLVEKDILPCVERVLACRFEPVEWWPQSPSSALPADGFTWSGKPGLKAFRQLFDRWFGI